MPKKTSTSATCMDEGIRTLYLHSARSKDQNAMHPYAVLVIRRAGHGFRAGLAVCAAADHFVRRAGRQIALERFYRRPLHTPSALELGQYVAGRLSDIRSRRPVLWTAEEEALAVPTTEAFCNKMRDAGGKDLLSGMKAAQERMYEAAQDFIRRVSQSFAPIPERTTLPKKIRGAGPKPA